MSVLVNVQHNVVIVDAMLSQRDARVSQKIRSSVIKFRKTHLTTCSQSSLRYSSIARSPYRVLCTYDMIRR